MQTDRAQAPLIALHDVRLEFAGRGQPAVQALAGVSLSVRPGEFVALLGPSGCGKSTVLRLIAGLVAPSAGRVEAPACDPAQPADTAFVFQEPTLMPWARLVDNVGLPLRLQGEPRERWLPRARQTLEQVGLGGFETAFPATLSGGMKMRGSIARALVTQPRVLLMDEPFAALDDITRQRLNADLLRWWQAQAPAVVFVTHSVTEAVFLSQRVLVMSPRPGRIVDTVAVEELHPRAPDWRHGTRFAESCRRVAEVLQRASEEAAP